MSDYLQPLPIDHLAKIGIREVKHGHRLMEGKAPYSTYTLISDVGFEYVLTTSFGQLVLSRVMKSE